MRIVRIATKQEIRDANNPNTAPILRVHISMIERFSFARQLKSLIVKPSKIAIKEALIPRNIF